MYPLSFLVPHKQDPMHEHNGLRLLIAEVIRNRGFAATADGPLPAYIVDAILKEFDIKSKF